MSLGGIPHAMLRDMTFDSFEPLGRARTREGQGNARCRSSCLRGFRLGNRTAGSSSWRPRCGKTHLAVAVANQQLTQGGDGILRLRARSARHLRYTFSPDSRGHI